MHHRRVLAPFCVALLLSCGARSPLDGPLPADGGIHPPPVPLPSDCTSALLADAPAPLFAYCSTRAYLTPTSAPRSPRVAWSTALPQGRNSAHEIVVDPQGRTYALLNSPSDTSGDADAVAAFDPSGALLWMQPFTGKDPADLFLGADGQLRFLLRTEPTETLVVMGTDGTIQHSYPLPVGRGIDGGGLAVGRDGSLFLTCQGPQSPLLDWQLAKLTPTGELVWISSMSDCTSRVVLTADDHAIVSTCDASPRLLELDDQGGIAWEADLQGLTVVDDPAVALDGSLRVVASDPGTSSDVPLHLLALDASGHVTWQVTLPGTGVNVEGSNLAIAADGTTIARTSTALVAVAANGTIRWQSAQTPSYAYAAAVDASGGVLIVAGSGGSSPLRPGVAAFDVASGVQRWTLDGFTAPFVLGLGGGLVSVQWGPDTGAQPTLALAGD